MKKLGSVDICGISYGVVLASRNEVRGLDEAYGVCAHDVCTIAIRDDLPPSCFENVIIHEMLHGLWQHSGLWEISDQSWDDLHKYEEAMIQALVPNLIRALKSLKKLRAA